MGLKHSFAPSPALVLLEKAFLNIKRLKGLLIQRPHSHSQFLSARLDGKVTGQGSVRTALLAASPT